MAHTCPVWLGYLLNCPLRKLWHNPTTVLQPYVKPGMTVLDVGCAMGFFTLPLARLVGSQGRTVAVDLQKGMLQRLRARAELQDLLDRMEFRHCSEDSLEIADLQARADFALAWFVIHEIPDQDRALREIRAALKPGGAFLLTEPAGHVRKREFEVTLKLAVDAGFELAEQQSRWFEHRAMLRK